MTNCRPRTAEKAFPSCIFIYYYIGVFNRDVKTPPPPPIYPTNEPSGRIVGRTTFSRDLYLSVRADVARSSRTRSHARETRKFRRKIAIVVVESSWRDARVNELLLGNAICVFITRARRACSDGERCGSLARTHARKTIGHSDSKRPTREWQWSCRTYAPLRNRRASYLQGQQTGHRLGRSRNALFSIKPGPGRPPMEDPLERARASRATQTSFARLIRSKSNAVVSYRGSCRKTFGTR